MSNDALAHRLIATCESCGEATSDGYVHINLAAIPRLSDQPPDGDFPEGGGYWVVECQGCAERSLTDEHYRISVVDVGTLGDLLHVTAHLLCKPWLTETSWWDILDGVRKGNGALRLGVQP